MKIEISQKLDSDKKPTDNKLPRYLAPAIVVSFGGLLNIVSMFLPHLSSSQVAWIENNMMIQNLPFNIILSIFSLFAVIRYWSTGSKSSAISAMWVGAVFLVWTLMEASNAQLVNLTTNQPINTTAGAGVWTACAAAAIVSLGGVMMRFPSIFGAIGPEVARGNADTKTCPMCAETIKDAAVVCRYCGHQLDEHD